MGHFTPIFLKFEGVGGGLKRKIFRKISVHPIISCITTAESTCRIVPALKKFHMYPPSWGYKPRWGGHDAPARNLLTSEGNICHSTLLNFHRKTRTFVRFWISAEQQTKDLVCFCVSLYVCLLSVRHALLFVLRWKTFVQFCLAANLLLASQRWKPADEQTRTLTYGHP